MSNKKISIPITKQRTQPVSVKQYSSIHVSHSKKERAEIDYVGGKDPGSFIYVQDFPGKRKESVSLGKTKTRTVKVVPLKDILSDKNTSKNFNARDEQEDTEKLLLRKSENNPTHFYLVKQSQSTVGSRNKSNENISRNFSMKKITLAASKFSKFASNPQRDTGILLTNKLDGNKRAKHCHIKKNETHDTSSSKSMKLKSDTSQNKHVGFDCNYRQCAFQYTECQSVDSYNFNNEQGNQLTGKVVNCVVSHGINDDSAEDDGKTGHVLERTTGCDKLCMKTYYKEKKIIPDPNFDIAYQSYNRSPSVNIGAMKSCFGLDQHNYPDYESGKTTPHPLPHALSNMCKKADTATQNTDTDIAVQSCPHTVLEHGQEHTRIEQFPLTNPSISAVSDSSDREPLVIKSIFGNEYSCVSRQTSEPRSSFQVHGQQERKLVGDALELIDDNQTLSKDIGIPKQQDGFGQTKCGYCLKEFTILSELGKHFSEFHPPQNDATTLYNQPLTPRKPWQSTIFKQPVVCSPQRRGLSKSLNAVGKFRTEKATESKKTILLKSFSKQLDVCNPQRGGLSKSEKAVEEFRMKRKSIKSKNIFLKSDVNVAEKKLKQSSSNASMKPYDGQSQVHTNLTGLASNIQSPGGEFKQQVEISKSITQPASPPYVCVECDMNFDEFAEFNGHSCNTEQQASREKIFQCGYCEESFHTADVCESHVFNHHVCDICFKTFPCLQVLKIHQKVLHPISYSSVKRLVAIEGVPNNSFLMSL